MGPVLQLSLAVGNHLEGYDVAGSQATGSKGAVFDAPGFLGDWRHGWWWQGRWTPAGRLGDGQQDANPDGQGGDDSAWSDSVSSGGAGFSGSGHGSGSRPGWALGFAVLFNEPWGVVQWPLSR